LSDSIEDERKQIFICLGLIENMLDFDSESIGNKLMFSDNLIDVLIKMLEDFDVKSENYLLAAEILATIVSSCHDEYKVKFA
jgi:hypothetical protein